VRHDGKVAGFVVGLLDLLHVHKEYQRCGIGGKLVEHIVRVAHDRQLPYIDLDATSSNSREFFRSRGFHPLPKALKSEFGKSACWMRLILDGKNHDQERPQLHVRWSLDYDPLTGRSRSREIRSEGERLYGPDWPEKVSPDDFDYLLSFYSPAEQLVFCFERSVNP
jgi:hypothetical protein